MARKRNVALFLSMTLLIVVGLTSCGDTTSVEEHFQKGNELVQAGEFEQAIAEFEAVLEKEPENISALSNLGVVYYNLGRLDEAIAQYQKAIELAPQDADIHSNLAAAYVQQEQLDTALTEYQAAVGLNPNLAEAHFGIGVIHLQKGEKDLAIVAFEMFQELDKGQDPMASDLAEQYLEQLKSQ
jgi:Flp pilus assembly protein TadD